MFLQPEMLRTVNRPLWQAVHTPPPRDGILPPFSSRWCGAESVSAHREHSTQLNGRVCSRISSSGGRSSRCSCFSSDATEVHCGSVVFFFPRQVLSMIINAAYKPGRVLRELQLVEDPHWNFQEETLKAKYVFSVLQNRALGDGSPAAWKRCPCSL